MIQWPKQRAWGWYATLIRTPWFCLKLLRFRPYGSLSMQRHFHRTEIWWFRNAYGEIKVKDNDNSPARITKFKNLSAKWTITPLMWHKFTAYDKPVYIMELQYGRRVTESDIERK
jgi:hypothetical protein